MAQTQVDLSPVVYLLYTRTELRNTGMRFEHVRGAFTNYDALETVMEKLIKWHNSKRVVAACKLLDVQITIHTRHVTMNPTHLGELS